MKFKIFRKYLADPERRALTFLHLGLVFNVGYAVFKLVTAVYYSSLWTGAVAVYYIMLSTIKFFLIKKESRLKLISDTHSRRLKGRAAYRSCGFLLLFLNAVMIFMVIQLIYVNSGDGYGKAVVIASAVYTFIRLGIALRDVLVFRHRHNYIISASKAISLSVALMSLFSLQTSMLLSIEADQGFRRLMNIISGAAVLIAEIAVSVYMVIHSNKKTED